MTHIVTDESDFNALPTLNAGDAVILQSGNYGALDKTLNSSISDNATAQANPIRIYAETAGTVNVTAPSKIYIEGRGIILAGLNFTSGSGMIDNESTSPASLIDLRPNSHYITLNNLKFDHCTTGDDYGHWIQVRGFNHTIEYCSFEGKDEPDANSIIAFKRNTSEPGDITTPRNHVLRYCYFGPRECSETQNGYEAIRIGDSSSQAHDMSVIIEHNVFYRTIWRGDGNKPNDPEIISNKTKGNIIRYNTFLESYGQITLRHGDACTVEGNFTFGGGYYDNGTIEIGSANPYQGGVRIIGQDHVVKNNYFENLQGTGLRGALVLMAGYNDFDDGNGSGGDNSYEPAHNAIIANNTFIDCEEFNLGEENGGTDQPTGVQIYNNAWQGNGTASNAIERNSNFTPSGSGGNYIYEPNSNDYGWTGLADSTYTDSDSPQITESYNHYRIPTSSSPLVGAANAALTVIKDIRSLTRPLSGQDIGSFERGLTGAEYGPLLRNEVGPLFDGGPSDTYPVDTITILPIASTASASAEDGANVAGNTLDDDLGTRWSANSAGLPEGQWIQFDMGDYYAVHFLHIAWHNGNLRTTNFDVEISDDGTNWRALATDQDSSGTTLQLESVSIPVSHGRYLRIVGYGYTSNDGNTTSGWNSITEVAINGLIAPTITAEEKVAPNPAKSGSSMSLTFDSVYGRRYQLQHTPILSPPDWQNIASVEIGTGSSMTLTDPDTGSDTQRFYRIEIKP